MNEEKEAIKYLEFLSNEKCECDACQSAKKKYKTILSLIDKQQKEIEEKEMLIKILRKTKPIEEVFHDLIKEKEYISKDKIREKIKTLEKEIETNSIYEENWNKIDILKELLEEN